MTGFVLTSFEGDLGTDPAFITWLEAKMNASVLAGYKVVEEAHKAILAGWATKPTFTARDIMDIGRLYQARELKVTGPIAWRWWLINDGGSTKKGPINKYMRFPYQGKGVSYSAATDTQKPYKKLPEGVKGTVFFDFPERSIAPRNMIGEVSKKRNVVFKAMEAAFNG